MTAREQLLRAVTGMNEDEANACLERLGLARSHRSQERPTYTQLLRQPAEVRDAAIRAMTFSVDLDDLNALERSDDSIDAIDA
jgi:hypothetical protein